MANSKRIALVAGAALALTVAYGVHSSGTDPVKETRRSITEQLLQMKKESLRDKLLLREQVEVVEPASAPDASWAMGAGRVRESEPNDTAVAANPLITNLQSELGSSSNEVAATGTTGGCAPGITAIGVIGAPGDVDYYSVVASAGAILKISIESDKAGAPTDTKIEVFGPYSSATGSCGPLLARRDDGNGFSGVSTDPCTFVKVPSAGTYMVKVTDAMGVGGNDLTYALTVSTLVSKETEPNGVNTVGNPLTFNLVDCVGASVAVSNGPGRPPSSSGNTCTTSGGGTTGANGLPVCSTQCTCVGGVIAEAGDVDCYNVDMVVGQALSVSVDGFKCASEQNCTALDPELKLYNPLGVMVARDDDTDDLDSGVFYSAVTAGKYKVCVQDHLPTGGSPCGFYQLQLKVRGCRLDLEPNNACSTATRMN